MSRWHESGCKRPLIECLDDTPCCTHCFALPSLSPNAGNVIPALLSSISTSGQKSEHDSLQFNEAVSSRTTCNSDLFPDIKPKQQMRLLRLSSTSLCTSVHIHYQVIGIRDHSLSSYEILSYARSRETAEVVEWRPIYIGKYWDVGFVPRHYEEILQSVRYKTADRLLWMECLCVNELDLHEKTDQVTMIPEIIGGATRTLMNLGPQLTEGCSAGIAVLAALDLAQRSSVQRVPISGRQIKALKSLMQHELFSTAQVVREVVLSKRLSLFSGRTELVWSDILSAAVMCHASAPRWLLGAAFRYDYTINDILWLVCEVGSYFSLDNRDKIFVLLGMFHLGDVMVDYKIHIETIYIHVAKHLIRLGLLESTILAAARQEKGLLLPSWVPNWSAVDISCLADPSAVQNNTQLIAEDEEHNTDWDGVTPIEFIYPYKTDRVVDFDGTNNRLRCNGVKWLCAIENATIVERAAHLTKLIFDRGSTGSLVITCKISSYEPGPDFLVLIPSMHTPVVIRWNAAQNVHTLICTCAVGQGPPIRDDHHLSWNDPTISMDVIRPESTLRDHSDLIQRFHIELGALCEMPVSVSQQDPQDPATMHTVTEGLIIDFAILSITGLLDLESTLREQWVKLEQELGWIFLDQQALSHFLAQLSQGVHGEISGRNAVPLPMDYFEMCDSLLPRTCHWDLLAFCQSFVSRSVALSSEVDHQSPTLLLLSSRQGEIRTWATVSAQLLLLFEYSSAVFRRRWSNFPGSSLGETWRQIDWDAHISDVSGVSNRERQRWNWDRFKTVLRLRSRVFSHVIPRELRYTDNLKIATQLSLRCLGLDLHDHRTVELN